jgi:hypothetical protein
LPRKKSLLNFKSPKICFQDLVFEEDKRLLMLNYVCQWPLASLEYKDLGLREGMLCYIRKVNWLQFSCDYGKAGMSNSKHCRTLSFKSRR